MKLKKLVVVGLTMMMVGLTACGGDDGGSKNEDAAKYNEKSKSQTDVANLDEALAQVKNCISDASISEITVVEGGAGTVATYIFTSESGKNYENGSDEFAELVFDNLDDVSTTSKADSKKDAIEVTIELNDNGGYKVDAEYVES